MWQDSSSNPANRVFDHFAVTMKKKNRKELQPYRTIKTVDNGTPETDRQVRMKFLSPRDNIDKYKSFPMTTENQVFSPVNKYIKAINMRQEGPSKEVVSKEMGILTNSIFLNDAYDKMEQKYKAIDSKDLLLDPNDLLLEKQKRK